MLPWCRGLADGLRLRDQDQIVMLGDSLTEGEDPDGYVNTTRQLLAQACPWLTIHVANAGKGGNTSVDMLARLDRDVLAFHPDWVVVSAGVNDVNHGFDALHPLGDGPLGISPAQYRQAITGIVRRCRRKGIRIVLLTPTVIKENLQSRENQRLRHYGVVAREVARAEGCLLVDMEQVFYRVLAPSQRTGMPDSGLLTGDGVHLLPEGNWLMAATLVEAMGVPAARIAAVRSAVDEVLRYRKAALASRLQRYVAANRGTGQPVPGEFRVVVIGSEWVEKWPLPPTHQGMVLLNRGLMGENLRQLRMRFHQDVVALRPEAAVLWLGDMEDFHPTYRMSLADVESHLARIARLAQGSGIRLAVGSVQPGCGSSGKACQRNPRLAGQARRLNEWIARWCKKNGYLFIDFESVLQDRADQPTGEHSVQGGPLGVGGYARVESLLWSALTEIRRRPRPHL